MASGILGISLGEIPLSPIPWAWVLQKIVLQLAVTFSFYHQLSQWTSSFWVASWSSRGDSRCSVGQRKGQMCIIMWTWSSALGVGWSWKNKVWNLRRKIPVWGKCCSLEMFSTVSWRFLFHQSSVKKIFSSVKNIKNRAAYNIIKKSIFPFEIGAMYLMRSKILLTEIWWDALACCNKISEKWYITIMYTKSPFLLSLNLTI